MKKRAKGEGSLYKTIQKKKRKTFDKRGECAICRNCTDRTECNNREGYIKCQKCKDCKTECLVYCDRFYCNEYTVAQVSVGGKQKTIATGKKQKDVNKKKTENLSKIENGKYVDKNKIIFSEQLKNTVKYRYKLEQIGDNTYTRNMDIIKSIEKKCPEIAKKRLQQITEDDILTILKANVDNSQSIIHQNYYLIKSSITRAIKDNLLSKNSNPISNINRNTILSNNDVKKAIPFTIEETQQLLEYINKYEYTLVNDKSAIDSISMKNLIKLNLAFGTRCGELGAIDINKHIDFEKKILIIKNTLTKNLNKEIVIGKYTKTGKKAKKYNKDYTRNVPFGVLYPEKDVEEILKEQIKHSRSIKNNTNNLLFCNKDGSYIDVKHITNMLKRICREAHIKLDLVSGCHIHMTKHTFVTRLIELGMNVYAISKLVGTSREVIEETYAHILDDFIEREIKKTFEKKLEQNLSISSTYYQDEENSNIIYLANVRSH